MSEPLGPAVTEEFPQVVGLHELVKGPPAPAPAAPAPAPAAPPEPPVELPKDLLKNVLTMLDTMVSNMVLRVAPESPEVMQQLTDNVTPLANYYARGQPTVAVLWVSAVVALAGYGYGKYAKVEQRKQHEAVKAAEPEAPRAAS